MSRFFYSLVLISVISIYLKKIEYVLKNSINLKVQIINALVSLMDINAPSDASLQKKKMFFYIYTPNFWWLFDFLN